MISTIHIPNAAATASGLTNLSDINTDHLTV
jgi:hypothetical protein